MENNKIINLCEYDNYKFEKKYDGKKNCDPKKDNNVNKKPLIFPDKLQDCFYTKKMHPKIIKNMNTNGEFTLKYAEQYNFPQQLKDNRRKYVKKSKIGIISFGGSYSNYDLDEYWKLLNIYPKPKINKKYLNFTNDKTNFIKCNECNNNEEKEKDEDKDNKDDYMMYSMQNTTDLQIIGSICPNAEITIYIVENNLQRIPEIFKHVFKKNDIITTSWGITEVYLGNKLLTEINDVISKFPRKIFCGPAGNNGCSDCISESYSYAEFPAILPHIIACGGTNSTQLHAGICEETAWSWNNSFKLGGGGGFSYMFKEQKNQKNIEKYNIHSDDIILEQTQQLINTQRKVPDISINSGNTEYGWKIFFNGELISVAGTGCSAPFIASFFGRCAFSLMKREINSAIYNIYRKVNKNGFNDIVKGTINNINIPKLFDARKNYDLATGLGSINGKVLYEQLKSYSK